MCVCVLLRCEGGLGLHGGFVLVFALLNGRGPVSVRGTKGQIGLGLAKWAGLVVFLIAASRLPHCGCMDAGVGGWVFGPPPSLSPPRPPPRALRWALHSGGGVVEMEMEMEICWGWGRSSLVLHVCMLRMQGPCLSRRAVTLFGFTSAMAMACFFLSLTLRRAELVSVGFHVLSLCCTTPVRVLYIWICLFSRDGTLFQGVDCTTPNTLWLFPYLAREANCYGATLQ